MSTVNICDRCDTAVTGAALGSLAAQFSRKLPQESFEWCPGCIDEFMEWLKTSTPGERPKAYKTPWEPPKSFSPEEIERQALVELAKSMMAKAENILDVKEIES